MKYFFKRVLPAPEKLKKGRILGSLLRRLGNPRIWMVNRRSIAGGMAAGLFFGSLPIPIQIPCAVCVAIFMRFNAPVAAFATLFSNPITMPPIFYFNYRIGMWLFGNFSHNTEVLNLSDQSLMDLGGRVLVPLYSGSIVVGLVLAFIGYFVVIFGWRWSLICYQKRRAERSIAALQKYANRMDMQAIATADNENKPTEKEE